jgi:hypothetical protein
MEPLYIEGSKFTPRVAFDKNKEIFQITGRSLPENALSFYEPVMEWFREYLNNPNPTTILTFELEYFNTASSKVISDIILMLEGPLSRGLDVKVNWCYPQDDEDTLETGQDYASLTNIPFVFNALAG